MRIRISMIALALGISCAASAQGIRQSVEVTNDYETRFTDFRKSGPEISVPDTLFRFDYSFDYSQFDTPYKGAYEFSPYEISLTPTPVPYDGKKFYMRAGLGYVMHPVFDFVYNPLTKSNLSLSLFNTGNGYFHAKDNLAYGKDDFGLSGRYLMRNAELAFQTGYDGIYAVQPGGSFMYHSGYVNTRITSGLKAVLPFEFGASYRYGTGQQDVAVSGYVAPGLGRIFDLRVNAAYKLSVRPSVVKHLVSATPCAQFSFGPVSLDAGATVDFTTGGGLNAIGLFPYVRANLELFDGAFNISAVADGGQDLPSGLELREINYFMNTPSGTPVAPRQKINAYLGFNGAFAKHFQFDLRGGYTVYEKALLAFYNAITPVDYNAIFADLSVAWLSERLTVDANFRFKKSIVNGTFNAFEDAPYSGDLRATYNWNRRVYAGVFAEGASARRNLSGTGSDIAGFVSPGIYGEYKFTQHVGAWLRAGNLACMKVTRFPGMVQTGPYFTAGISLGF